MSEDEFLDALAGAVKSAATVAPKTFEILLDPEFFRWVYEQWTPEQRAEWERRKGDAPTG